MSAIPGELGKELAGLTPLRPLGLRAVDQVHAALRQALADGTVCPGTRLLETQVADQLGVSRTPVREAFQRLETEGLAHRTPGRGLVFTDISPADVADLGMVRICLDGLAARLAVERTGPEGWQVVDRELDRLDEAIHAKVDRRLRVREAHRAFHLAIYQLAFTPLVSALLETNLLGILDISSRLHSSDAADLVALEDHRSLLQALRSGDLALASSVANAHATRGVEEARQARAGRQAPTDST